MWLCASCMSALGAAWNCCVTRYPISLFRFAAGPVTTAALTRTKAYDWCVVTELEPLQVLHHDSLIDDKVLDSCTPALNTALYLVLSHQNAMPCPSRHAYAVTC